MNCYIALLRGINVGGHKRILMADLRMLLESSGLENVQTYIQSGNVVFSFDGTAEAATEKISEAIESKYGWKVPILVKKGSELAEIIQNCPFSEEKRTKSYFTLFDSEPNRENIEIAQQASHANEEFYITPQCLYMFYALGAGKAKLGNNWFEKKLKVKATSRNYNTMVKLVTMAATD